MCVVCVCVLPILIVYKIVGIKSWLRLFIVILGAHCLDLINSTPDDPDWLITQRGREIKIIEVWISEYKARLATNADKQNWIWSEAGLICHLFFFFLIKPLWMNYTSTLVCYFKPLFNLSLASFLPKNLKLVNFFNMSISIN